MPEAVVHPVAGGFDSAFDFERADFAIEHAHGGELSISVARVRGPRDGSAIAFIDLSVLPPNASVGEHRHGSDEEIYVIVAGVGTVRVEGVEYAVRPGSVVVNPPHGRHALRNTGTEPLRMVVVDIDATRGGDD